MKVGSLFAGIGGFDLGLERAGFEIAWQVEIDPWCRRILAKHWPNVPRYGDIRTIDWAAVPRVDILCGGFPCQDISLAGKGAGLDGARSGLWREYAKAIDTLRPQWVLIENVSALRSRGLDQVLGTLTALGYDAEWDCIPATAVGAPHQRDRIWIVAYPTQFVLNGSGHTGAPGRHESANSGEAMADSTGAGPQGYGAECELGEGESQVQISRSGWWDTEPELGRVAHGVPKRVDRLRGLGNAIVPQIAEWFGREIVNAQISQDA